MSREGVVRDTEISEMKLFPLPAKETLEAHSRGGGGRGLYPKASAWLKSEAWPGLSSRAEPTCHGVDISETPALHHEESQCIGDMFLVDTCVSREGAGA